MARRIRRNPGYVSKVINGRDVSYVVWGRIHRFLEREEAKRMETVA